MSDPDFEALARRRPLPHPRVLEAIRADLAKASPEPARALSRGTRLALSVLLLFAGFAATTFGDWFERGALWFLGAAGACFSLGALVLSETLPGPRTRLGLGARRALVVSGVAVVLVFYSILADDYVTLAEFFGGGSRGREHVSHALACLAHALVTGFLCSTGLLLVWARTDPFTPTWSGAILGLSGSWLGSLAVSLGCRATEGLHLILGHGMVAVIATLAAALLGRKWLRP